MISNDWSEEKITQQLKNMPDIRDERSVDEILHRLKSDERLFVETEQAKKSFSWIPIVATLAALLFAGLVIPLMMMMSSYSDQAADSVSYKMESSKEDSGALYDEGDEESVHESELEDLTEESDNLRLLSLKRNVVLQEDLYDHKPLQIGLVSDKEVIPVTFLIPIKKIKSDFTIEQPSNLELYLTYSEAIDEALLGFTPYHPYQGKLIEEDGTIIHQIDSGVNNYTNEEELNIYETTVLATFSQYDKWILVKKDKTLKEISLTQSNKNKVTSYYKYSLGEGETYLVNEENTGGTIQEALFNMKHSFNRELETVIPSDMNFDVIVEDNLARIYFHEKLDLSTFDYTDAILFIEAFMLTASKFNMAIHFDNIEPFFTDYYDVTAPLPIPVGSNPIANYFEWKEDRGNQWMFGNMYAISIDLCSHSDLFMIMNHYVLSQTETIEEQVEKIAEKDVAPLVRVCIGEVKDWVVDDFYVEYFFKKYECSCDS